MKTIWKKIGIWSIVIALFAGTVISTQVFAAPTTNNSNGSKTKPTTSAALNAMKEAGKIQLVTNTFARCVKSFKSYDVPVNFDNGGVFYIGHQTEISTGAWLENQVQGKVNNGTIYCSDGKSQIVDVLAKTLGVDKNTIYCDGEKPGLLKLQNQDENGKWHDVKGKCASGLGNSDLRFMWNKDADGDAALKYIKKLYEAKRKENDYLPAWGDIDTYKDDKINYFLYFNDFATACSREAPYSGDMSLLNKSNYFAPLKVPNPSTGKLEDRYYSKQNIIKSDWHSNWIVSYNGGHTCDSVIERMNKEAPAVQDALKNTTPDETTQSPDDVVGDITDTAGDTDAESEGSSPCSKAGAALGWIICPVTQLLGAATSGMYSYLENNFLQVDNRYVGSGSGTHQAWEIFRNFANIAFAIVLLIIILSQITGYGVSNYGVKKMLPSFILVAVLVNISFFLCQIAVDVSNMSGYGLNELFSTRISQEVVPTEFNDGSLGSIVEYTGQTLLSTSISGLAAGSIGYVLYKTYSIWIWGFLLSLIVAAISVLVFFLLLGIRQAAIIILVALSPLAIICYALPNTKNLFSRWWKMFSGMLLVYPICGLLMGGGKFASKLLLANLTSDTGNSFFFVLVAMLIQAVPFFFIPSLVRSSFQAIGNIGTKISNMGRTLGKDATHAIRQSEGYKSAQVRGRARYAEKELKRREKAREAIAQHPRRSRFLHPVASINDRLEKSSDPKVAERAMQRRNRREAQLYSTVRDQELGNLRDASTAELGWEGINNSIGKALAKEREEYYSNNDFSTDTDLQKREYLKARDAVINNPDDQKAIANLIGMQRVIAKTDPGRRIIENAINESLYNAEQEALASGTEAQVPKGLRRIGQSIMSEHGGFKGTSRGFYSTLVDMNKASNPGAVFKNGAFERQTVMDKDGNAIQDADGNTVYSYGNRRYDAKVAESTAQDLAGADERTLERANASIANMSTRQLENYFLNGSNAISNESIAIKPANEKLLNEGRQLAYDRAMAEAKSDTSLYDDRGRTFTSLGGNQYQYEDVNHVKHIYTRDATGQLVGKPNPDGSQNIIHADKITTASERARRIFGDSYEDLHAGLKVRH